MAKVMNDLNTEEFLKRYIEGERIVDIAKELGVGKTTLYDLLKSPEIVKRLGKERDMLQNQTRAMLQKDATKYIKNIQEIANNSTDVRSKLKANETLLAYILGTPTNKVETVINENINVDSNIISKLYENNTNNNEEEE